MVPEGWKILELGELAKFTSGGTPSKSNDSYWGGSHPWISGKDLKQHYLSTSIDMLTDEGFGSTNKAPAGSTLVLVRGMTLLKDFPVGFATRPLAFNQDLKALIPEKNIDGLFLSFLLAGNKEKIRQLVSTAGHGTGRLDTESLKAYPVMVPHQLEQKKIAKILATWDQAIASATRVLENSLQQKKGLIQQLLGGGRRLAGFMDDWRLVSFGKIFRERGETGWDSLPLLSITSEEGVIDREETGRKDTSNADKSKYLRICPGDIGYNTMRMWQGVSGLSTLEGLVSPAYTVLTPQEGIDPLFAAHLFKLPALVHVFYRHSQGLVSDTWNLKYSNFSKIKWSIPCVEEQKAIAAVLSTNDHEIKTLQTKLACLKQEKKALMQQLLTGKRRVKVDELEVA